MKNILKQINTLAFKISRPIVLMELCGTHTEAVARHGVKKLLPKNIKLLSGPGCPVCVTDQRDINAVIALAMEGIPITCYGDVLRVPGNIQGLPLDISKGSPWKRVLSLNKARELGADITEVYSVEDALKLKESKPNIVFFGLGFETTTPMTASAIKRGLTVYSSHKAFVPAMAALLAAPTLKIDGFINPGHVSAIIGIEPYKKLGIAFRQAQCDNVKKIKGNNKKNVMLSLSNHRPIPQVIAGFAAEDVIMAIYMLLKQIAENRADVENEYTRLVRPEGNPKAMELINEVFKIGDAYWRGIGKIPNSGFKIKKKYAKFDAKVKYKNILREPFSGAKGERFSETSSSCICGAILRGLKEPQDCKLFNKKCTPENPVGACMVSSEGACGIEAKFTPTPKKHLT
jgi:hydrogenase expression/formation protein HypD